MGVPRREFLYALEWWEARRIMRGYGRRSREMWGAIRWHAFNVMAAMPYTDLAKSGITSPSNLIEFPWEKAVKAATLPSDKEVEEIEQMIREEQNAIR